MPTDPNIALKAAAAAETSAVLRASSCSVTTDKPAYRPDIDGLRAIAVLLVMIFHGGLAVFPSGFIGVDIFFVISGYLTTGIILKGLARDDFSLGQFYVRRMWRLQPAIIALLLGTLTAAAFFYLPRDFIEFLKSEKYTSLLLSNQYFAKATDGYASADAATLPLLHTWSLAIEWQWYVVLPVGLLLLNRVLGDSRLRIGIVLLTAASISTALYVAAVSPDKSYYSFLARIFELLIGSCVAIVNNRKELGRFAASLVGAGAVGILLYSATAGISTTAYPGLAAVLVALATGALVSEQVGRSSVTSTVLTSSPIVFIGTISYSLYLWHWPVIAVVNYLGIEKTPMVIVGYFAASFSLGLGSYYLIEKPFRRLRMGFRKTLILLIAVPAIVFSALYAVGKHQGGWAERFGTGPDDILARLEQSEIPQRKACLGSGTDNKDSRCVLGQAGSGRTALLIGDSYSNHFIGFVDTLAKDANVSVLAQAAQGCLALPDIYLYDWWKYRNTLFKKCHDAAVAYHQLIADNHYDFVVIGFNWKAYAGSSAVVHSIDDERSQSLSRARMKDALMKSLAIITASGATPVLFESNMSMPVGANDCVYRSIKLRKTLAESDCPTSVPAPLEDPWLSDVLRVAQHEFPRLIVIDPKDVQCREGQCDLVIDGLPVYRDIGHITDYASTAMGRRYLKSQSNPFNQATP